MQVQISKNKNPCKAFAYKGLAQAVRFELTCLYGKLISSQPRYDHFDTLAYLIVIYCNLIRNKEKRLAKFILRIHCACPTKAVVYL